MPKGLSEGSQFALVTKFGACLEVMVGDHVQIYQGKQSNAIDQFLETRVINNMVL